jgi:hypothetical protein
MKKLILLVTTVTFVFSSFGAATLPDPASKPPVKASEVYIPIGKSGEKISLLDLSTMKIKDLQQLTGKKLNLVDRVGFKMAQKKLRQSINNDGTFNQKKVSKFFNKSAEGSGSFHIGGFALGFLLGLIGVLIAYLINDDNKSVRVKWAWLGLAAWVVILLLVLVV